MLHLPRRCRATSPRRRTAVRIGAWIAAAVLGATALPLVAGTGSTRATAVTPTTITGTVSGRHAWNPATGQPFADEPSVTVDQTTGLTDQVVHVTWQHFTPSGGINGYEGKFYSQDLTTYPVTVMQCKGTDPARPLFDLAFPNDNCYTYLTVNQNADHGAGNRVATLTGSTGEGEAYFHIEDSLSNDQLGCDATQDCSLVIVPNWGGIQPTGVGDDDPSVDCDGPKAHNFDTKSGQLVKHGEVIGPFAVPSSLAGVCSWGDRFVVPLKFAPTTASCPDQPYAFASEGAPMLARTLSQWQAGWCTDSNALTFDYDGGTNEYLARSSFLQGSGALTATIDSAIVTRPAANPSGRPFTYAPIDNSAITVAYHIDDQKTGKLITDLTLNARLVAKLITQSYSLAYGCAGGQTVDGPECDKAVNGNPQNIFDDPEFQQLNPQYTRSDFPDEATLSRGSFLPLVVSGNSDMTYELTRWVASDPKAMAFIAGTPDENGMTVNSYYKDEILPLDQFQNLDPGYTAPSNDTGPGQSTMQVSWNPIGGLSNVVQSLVIDRPSAVSPDLVIDPPNPSTYKRYGSQSPGIRALFAIVGLNDSAANRFPTAKLVNAGGAAVGPTDSALAAGYAAMTTNADKITQSADYSVKDTAAYPLVTRSYAMVPTCGLTSAKATALKSFLTKVGTSQTVGLDPGQLAPGNVPLTGAQQSQLGTAAKAIGTASCTEKNPSRTSPTSTGTNSGATNGIRSGSTSGTDGQSSQLGGDTAGGGGGDTNNAGTVATGNQRASTAPSSSRASAEPGLAAYGVKHGDGSGGLGFALPLLLILTALLIIGGPGLFVLSQSGSGQSLLAGLRRRSGR